MASQPAGRAKPGPASEQLQRKAFLSPACPSSLSREMPALSLSPLHQSVYFLLPLSIPDV